MSPILIFLIVFISIAIILALNSTSAVKGRREKAAQIKSDFRKLQPKPEMSDAEYRDAVVQMDTLLNKALQHRHNNKLTCGENLKLAKDVFTRAELNAIWDFHKLRNNVVHDGTSVDESDAKEMYNVYAKSIEKIL